MTEISHIDQAIDAIRDELCRREKVKPLDAGSWQQAWDRNPDLHSQETELWKQRGRAQQERDARAIKARLSAPLPKLKNAPPVVLNR